MKMIIKLVVKKYNIILTEKQQKYRHYRPVKLVNKNIFMAKEYYLLNKLEIQNKLRLLILL